MEAFTSTPHFTLIYNESKKKMEMKMRAERRKCPRRDKKYKRQSKPRAPIRMKTEMEFSLEAIGRETAAKMLMAIAATNKAMEERSNTCNMNSPLRLSSSSETGAMNFFTAFFSETSSFIFFAGKTEKAGRPD